jgi:uncharacterized sulfatase
LDTQALNDMYDAEVAYQDDYLGKLFAALNGRSRHNNTLTVIVSDHGDGLGEHNYFGHAFTAYQELVHVPLIVHWPQQIEPGRVDTPVSTRRVYHTMLEAIGRLPQHPHLNPTDIHNLTLRHTIAGRDPENGTAFSEVYPPLNFVRAIESRQPHLLAHYRCLSLRRAIVKQEEGATTFKLIQVDDEPDELFDLQVDPLEMEDLQGERPSLTPILNQELNQIATKVKIQREHLAAGDTIEMDEGLLQQLRGLGYIE